MFASSFGFWPIGTVAIPLSMPARSRLGCAQSSWPTPSRRALEQRSLQAVFGSLCRFFPSASETQIARRVL